MRRGGRSSITVHVFNNNNNNQIIISVRPNTPKHNSSDRISDIDHVNSDKIVQRKQKLN